MTAFPTTGSEAVHSNKGRAELHVLTHGTTQILGARQAHKLTEREQSHHRRADALQCNTSMH